MRAEALFSSAGIFVKLTNIFEKSFEYEVEAQDPRAFAMNEQVL